MSASKSPLLSGESDKFIPFSDNEFDEAALTDTPSNANSRRGIRAWLLAAQSLLLLAVTIAWASSIRSRHGEQIFDCQVLYSPAQDALEYRAKRFVEDIWAPNIYKEEPSPEVDEAWAGLYNDFGLSQIPKWQADRLPNRTLPIPADPQYYVMQLTVFHQMHCLNTIRKALSPEYYVDPLTGDLGNIKQANLHHHLTHCIDSIRQGLMCGADISPIVWVWSDRDHRAYIDMDVVHSCRNYDRVVDWAKENRIKQHFDWSTHVAVDEAETRDA